VTSWIFFDCFNTLIDDFDGTGDESGLGSLPGLAVELGAAVNREEFLAAYRRACPVNSGDYAEVLFTSRLTAALESIGRLRPEDAGRALQRLLEHWHAEYEPGLRLTPGVREMLAHWHGTRRLAVVSNFHLPGYPARYLERFGIAHYFDFVIDSAAFGHRKPGALIFEMALRRAGCDWADVLFVGDRLDLDIEPAHRQGMETLYLDRRAHRPRVPRTPAGVRSVRHWDEFRRDRS
jgi:HAD superfamily hydrolase (TIGR01549 family)